MPATKPPKHLLPSDPTVHAASAPALPATAFPPPTLHAVLSAARRVAKIHSQSRTRASGRKPPEPSPKKSGAPRQRRA
jgi:hypothetical protein